MKFKFSYKIIFQFTNFIIPQVSLNNIYYQCYATFTALEASNANVIKSL